MTEIYFAQFLGTKSKVKVLVDFFVSSLPGSKMAAFSLCPHVFSVVHVQEGGLGRGLGLFFFCSYKVPNLIRSGPHPYNLI